jgi:large conductance mechanosensitive channel
MQEGFEPMLKGFKEFLSRGNIVDLSVAVVIGTAFTGLVTKFTDSIIQPLINRVGAGGDSDYGILRINIGGGQTIDLNILLSAAINFILVAAVVYFLVVVPYNRLRKKGEVEQAQDTELSLLTEIRNLLAETNGQSGKHVRARAPARALTPPSTRVPTRPNPMVGLSPYASRGRGPVPSSRVGPCQGSTPHNAARCSPRDGRPTSSCSRLRRRW